jgi:hypothetical protein
MLNSQRFAKCSHLWPSSVFKRTPVAGFQIITVLSELPLAMSPSIDQATAQTGPLPFLNMSVTALPLSPAAGLNTNAKCSHLWPFRHKIFHLWPFRHKIFAPICAQMSWMRPSPAPACRSRRERANIARSKFPRQSAPFPILSLRSSSAAPRLHGTQRGGMHTASCGGARSRRLHSAARSP